MRIILSLLLAIVVAPLTAAQAASLEDILTDNFAEGLELATDPSISSGDRTDVAVRWWWRQRYGHQRSS